MRPVRHFPSLDRLSVLTAVIILAYALARFLDLPAQAVGATLFGATLGVAVSGPLLIQLLVAALISTGADLLIRSHPRYAEPAAPRTTVVHWIVPGAAALVVGAGLERLPDGPAWWAGLAGAAFTLMAVLVAEFTVVDHADPGHDAAGLALGALAYGLALVMFAILHSSGMRALAAAGIAGVVAAGLAWRLFVLNGASLACGALYGLVVGLICAEALWAVLYWRVGPGAAAALLMLVFYLSAGLAGQHLAGRLTRRVWLEYGLVGLLGAGLLAVYLLR